MKKFIVSSFAAIALIAGTSAYAATAKDMGTSTIGYKSPMMYVQNTQENLNVCAGATPALAVDGKYGSKTTMAAKNFQMAKGLSVDGKIGPMTKAALIAACGGTTTTTTTTGGLCPNGMTLASNCTLSPTSTTVSSVEGYVADINSDSSNRVSTVYESESNKVIGGIRMTARLSDQKIEAIRVTLKNVNTLTSSNLGKYATSISLMDGSTVLATLPIASLDRASDDTYTAQFTGISKTIAKDTIGRLYVAVNANGSIDSNDTLASWTLKFVDVRSVSPNGVYIVNASSPLPVVFTGVMFNKFSTSGVKATVNLASSNPLAMTKEVSETAATNDIKLLDFKVKAEVSEMTLRNLPVKIAMTIPTVSAVDQPVVINNIKLMKDGVMIDSISPAAGTMTVMGTNNVYMTSYVFANIAPASAKIAVGTEATFSILVDVKASKNGATVVYPSGTTTLAASVSNVTTTATTAIAGVASTTIGQPSYPAWSVQDVNGDQVVSRTGSAFGNVMTLAARGVSVALASANAGAVVTGPAGSLTNRVDYIDVNVSAFGDTVYVADIFNAANATAKNSAGGTVAPTSVTISNAPGETITKQASDFVVNSGETKKFRIAISLTGTAANATAQVKSQLTAFEVKIGSAGAAVTAQPLDVNTFQTSFAAL